MTRGIVIGRRKFLRDTSLAAGLIVAPTIISARSASAQTSTIVVAGWGGDAQRAVNEAVSKPFTAETGVGVRDVVAVGTMVQQIKAQVENNNPEWDAAMLTGPEAYQLANGGYLADLRYEPELTGKMSSELLDKQCAAQFYAAFVLGWNPAKFSGSREPKTWADFWNVEDFPGRRSACGWFPFYMIEIALMADGVPKEQVYPMTSEKINRAFQKIRELRPNINVWWNSGGQSVQLFVDKEIDITMMYSARLLEAERAGAKAKWSIAQPMLEAQWLAVPKASRNLDAAIKWVNVALRKEAQAALIRSRGAPPTNPAAFDLLTPDEKARGLGDPEMVKNGLLLDSRYWAVEYPKYLETWEAIKTGR